ncbi:MAG: competence protein ComEC, partial [Algoriphagus sp.]
MELKSYPILRLILFLIPGILIYEYALLTTISTLSLGISSLSLFGIGLLLKKRIFHTLGIYLFIVCLGWFSAFRAKQDLNQYPAKTQGYLVRINSATETKPKSYKVLGEVYTFKNDSIWQSINDDVLLYFTNEGEKPIYGDVFLINGAPREIEGPKNPFEFDYKNFLSHRGIENHHFLRQDDYQKMGYCPKYKLFQWAYSISELASQTLRSNLTEKADLSVAEAMLLGTKDELDHDTRDAYATAGAIHILAVSGLHVGILMLMLNVLFGFLNRRKKTMWLYGIITISLLWVYALFTGMSPSVTRATLMFSLFQLGSLFLRDKNSINVLAASAFILLLIEPFWLFEVGFQLSYLAIFGIIYLFPYLNKLYEPKSWLLTKLYQITIVSVSAQLFTFPLSIYYFHQFPSYFLLTNPLVTVFSMGVLFLGIPFLLLSWLPFVSDFILIFFKITLWGLNKSIFLIAGLPHSKLDGFSLSIVEVIALFLLLFMCILFFLQKRPRYLYLGLIILAGLSISNIYEDFYQKDQREAAFHFIPRASGFSLINSKSALFLTDSATKVNPRAYDFHLKNYYDDRGIKHYEIKVPQADKGMLEFTLGEKKYLWIQKYVKGKVKDEFDYILVSNNALYNLEKQLDSYPKILILDD